MMTLQHQDCEECRLNVEIISVNGDLISKQILQGGGEKGSGVFSSKKAGDGSVKQFSK